MLNVYLNYKSRLDIYADSPLQTEYNLENNSGN